MPPAYARPPTDPSPVPSAHGTKGNHTIKSVTSSKKNHGVRLRIETKAYFLEPWVAQDDVKAGHIKAGLDWADLLAHKYLPSRCCPGHYGKLAPTRRLLDATSNSSLGQSGTQNTRCKEWKRLESQNSVRKSVQRYRNAH